GPETVRRPSATAAAAGCAHRPTTKASRLRSNSSGSNEPDRCAATTGTSTATDSAHSGTEGTDAQIKKKTTGNPRSTKVPTDAGPLKAATTATAKAKHGTRRRNSGPGDQMCSHTSSTVLRHRPRAHPPAVGSGPQATGGAAAVRRRRSPARGSGS